jgi:hypothetical protein
MPLALFLTQLAVRTTMTLPAARIPRRLTIDLAVLVTSAILIGIAFWVGVL